MRRFALVAFGLLFSTFSSVSAGEFQIKHITDLHRIEAYRGHHLQNGMLLVGKRALEGKPHRIEFYDTENQALLHTLEIPHTVGQIWSLNEKEAVVVGKLPHPWRTFYTIIRTEKKKLKIKKTYEVPQKYQIDKFASLDGKLYFNDRGSRSIIQKSFFGFRKLPVGVSGPDDMIGAHEHLWIVESRSIGHGDESLIKYDPKTKTSEQLLYLELGKRGINSLVYAEDQNLIVIDDAIQGRIIAIDASSNEVVSITDAGTDIRSLAVYGSCIAALRTTEREVVFLKLSNERQLNVVDTWAFERADERLKNPVDLVVDSTTGVAYVRSVLPCLFCAPDVTYSSVQALIPANDDLRGTCHE